MKLTTKQKQTRIVKIERLINKYLKAVDDQFKFEDLDQQTKADRECDKQTNIFGQLEDYPRSAIKETCKQSEVERVQAFFSMYMK